MIKVRFAPSPTGFIHLGNTRAAILNYMFTKSNNGKMILRIDDTDKERSRPEYEKGIYEDLQWLNIIYDEVYKQSERNDIYESAFNKLVSSGNLYPCYETKEELDEMRTLQLQNKKPPVYNRKSLHLTEDEKKNLENQGITPHWRFKLDHKKIEFYDIIHKNIKFDLASVSDPVVRKADGNFTYTFASCVDDIDLKITHIIRGDDHLTNTASQIEILKALNPDCGIILGHYPLINFEESGKMSKRLGDISIKTFKNQGLEPETIMSFLCKIGTSDPVKPCFDLLQLLSEFDLNKISKSSPKIFLKDMFDLNRKFLSSMTFDQAKIKYNISSDNFWNLIKDNLFSKLEISVWEKILNKGFVGEKVDQIFVDTLYKIIVNCNECENWIDIFIEESKKELKNSFSTKEIFQNMRIIITGVSNGPHFADILQFIGYEETKSRIQKLLNI